MVKCNTCGKEYKNIQPLSKHMYMEQENYYRRKIMLNILEKVFKRKGGDLNKSGTTMDKNMIFTHNCAARI